MKTHKKHEWVPRKLNELGFVGRGKSRHRPRNAPELYGGPYPFVQTAEIMASELYITSHAKTYSEVGIAQSKMWQANTLCMTIAGENTAETALLSYPACFPDSVVGFVADPELSDVRFVKYYLDYIKKQIRQITRGATQDNLSLDKLLSFDIVAPPVAMQRKIASIAAAYDELILNNTRRIALLEAISKLIYREWFVQFRFPGHEKVKLIPSPLGKIPEGWRVVKVVDVAVIHRGRSYKSENLVEEGGIPFLNLKCIGRGGGFRRDGIKRFEGPTKPEQITRAGEIVMGVTDMTQERRLVARAALVPRLKEEESVISMDLVKISPNGVDSLFLYGMLRFSEFPEVVKQHANGANVLHLNPKAIADYGFACPAQQLQTQYASKVSGLVELVDVLHLKIENLRTTRDLLLPKLISGQLDVEDIDTGAAISDESVEADS